MPFDKTAAIETIMTRDLITLHPKDTLSEVKEVFQSHTIHHIPVVEEDKMLGIVSKTDLDYYERHYDHLSYGKMLEEGQLRLYKLEDVMTKGLATLTPKSPISDALELLKENIFHAIPIEQEGKLVGIVTPHDIICALAD